MEPVLVGLPGQDEDRAIGQRAGAVAAAARAIAGGTIRRAAIDTKGFRFVDLKTFRDPQFLSGAVKYGDVPALLALSAPHDLFVGGEASAPELTADAYRAADRRKALAVSPRQDVADAAVDWLLGR